MPTPSTKRLLAPLLCAAALWANTGCAELEGRSLLGGILERTDNGAFAVLLEAEHLADAELGEFFVTVAMPDPSDVESVAWIVPGAVVDVEVLQDGAVVGSAAGLSPASDGRHSLEGIPVLYGEGPWTFEIQIAVDDQVSDSVVFRATP